MKLDAILAKIPLATSSRSPSAPDSSTEFDHAVLEVARQLQQRGTDLQTPQERRQQRELERMMATPQDKVTLTQLTDQAFRTKTPKRVADQLIHILDVQGVPRYFNTVDRAMLRGFQSFGGFLPGVAIPMVKEKMRAETANVILPAEHDLLAPHLRARRDGGVRMNVNYLGEALLGETEAQARLKSYLDALQQPEIEVMSVKISTLYSQITSLARHASVKALCDRMELLYRTAYRQEFVRADGTAVKKFVYLDMEEYRDLSITLEVFQKTLSREGLQQVNAGIALQAYVPDSYGALVEVTEWARRRRQQGGAPVTVRIVKGANLEMERVDASVAGWPQAPYNSKRDTDANYKKMIEYALRPENIDAVTIGVASHNLFDVAYAIVLGHQRGVMDGIQFEMLEGMANHQRRALAEVADNILLYAPATRKSEFLNAIGYLLRRLDENTGPDNFLRHAFKLDVGSPEWLQLEQDFLASLRHVPEVSVVPRRQQDRRRTLTPIPLPTSFDHFVNEPDTDFALEANRTWVADIIAAWKPKCGDAATNIPIVVGGQAQFDGRENREVTDPSRPNVVVTRYALGTKDDLETALTSCGVAQLSWQQRSEEERAGIFEQVAHQLRVARGDLVGAALAEAGKTPAESDPEISEAIDFAAYYGMASRWFRQLDGVTATPLGVVAVVPPWNFPIAIPCGGIAAALAAGNGVIVKPAPAAVMTAHLLCECFWRAGIPRDLLQFLPCSEADVAPALVCDERVAAVILTGATDTAKLFLKMRPDMRLLAETGGKNATIVTAMSDRDAAIKHLLHSAFSHSGQKCSATSLLVLEREVYDDLRFRDTLCDAITSLKVGSAWDLATKIGPLITPPRGPLERSMKELEKGESWAVIPRNVDDNPHLFSPGVRWGTERGSFAHHTEFFGPMLSVMCAEDLDDAISIVNGTGFGLTSGLESLDAREKEHWRSQIEAGNLYINRVTTGAIVQRQPFGGFGLSAFGLGIKAGGPNYVAQLMTFTDDHREADDASAGASSDAAPAQGPRSGWRFGEAIDGMLQALREHGTKLVTGPDQERLATAVRSYADANIQEFALIHDHVQLVGQDNHRRYQPAPGLWIRVEPSHTPFEILARILAAKTIGGKFVVSAAPGTHPKLMALLDAVTVRWGGTIAFAEQDEAAFCDAIRAGLARRIRLALPNEASAELRAAAADANAAIVEAPVVSCGRIELIWYTREQSVSSDYHRYGNLGGRHDEPRSSVL